MVFSRSARWLATHFCNAKALGAKLRIIATPDESVQLTAKPVVAGMFGRSRRHRDRGDLVDLDRAPEQLVVSLVHICQLMGPDITLVSRLLQDDDRAQGNQQVVGLGNQRGRSRVLVHDDGSEVGDGVIRFRDQVVEQSSRGAGYNPCRS